MSETLFTIEYKDGNFDDYTFNVIQEPYLDTKTFGLDKYEGYFAIADDENNSYQVFWSIENGSENDDINWENPTKIWLM